MKTSVSATKSSGAQQGSQLSLVKPQFRKNFKIDILPYQTNGILSRSLWPSKNHVIRIIPGYDPETGEVFHQNVNCSTYSKEADPKEYLSDTFFEAHVVDKFNSINTPFISDYAPGSLDADQWQGETVIHNFIRDIMYACRNKDDKKKSRRSLVPAPEWFGWTGIGPSNALKFDSIALLMQVLGFTINGRNNRDFDTDQDLVDEDGDLLPLLMVVAITGKQSLINLKQDLVTPANRALPLDAKTNNSLGPMAEMEGNKLFLNSTIDNSGEKAHYVLQPSVQAEPTGWNPSPFPLDESAVKALWHPWNELLEYMDAQEQLKLCAREFGADTVNYVIGNNYKLKTLPIPTEIANAGLGRYANINAQGSVSFTTPPAAPKTKGITFGKPAPATTPEQEDVPPSKRPGLSGIQRTSTLDMDKINASLKAIRKASGNAPAEAPEDQAAAANDLLGIEE